VRLVVFSADGRRVTTLLDEQMGAGRHQVAWNGRDDHGVQVATGVYFARIEAGPLKETHKMLLLK
jgi:flagellar hook assembly protein FlgD